MYPDFLYFFFFNDTATTEIYTLSLHDALPISRCQGFGNTIDFDLNLVVPDPSKSLDDGAIEPWTKPRYRALFQDARSEEHTSELQSHSDLVCRLLLEKKKDSTQSDSKANQRTQ